MGGGAKNRPPVVMGFDRYTKKYELVPDNVSESEVKDEANFRASKVGFCTRNGEQTGRTRIMSDPPTKVYEENYIKIFGHS